MPVEIDGRKEECRIVRTSYGKHEVMLRLVPVDDSVFIYQGESGEDETAYVEALDPDECVAIANWLSGAHTEGDAQMKPDFTGCVESVEYLRRQRMKGA